MLNLNLADDVLDSVSEIAAVFHNEKKDRIKAAKAAARMIKKIRAKKKKWGLTDGEAQQIIDEILNFDEE